MPKKPSKSKRLASEAFSEVSKNPPQRVRQTLKAKGKTAARKQSIAIALSKARAKGARFKKKK